MKKEKLTLRQLDLLHDSIMRMIRQDAIDGKSCTVYYLYPEPGKQSYMSLIRRLRTAGFTVKYEHITNEPEDYCQLTIRWKENVMSEDLALIQKQLEDDNVETFDEMIDSLYREADSLFRIKTNNERLTQLYKKTGETILNIARRINKTWCHMTREQKSKKENKK